MLQSDLTALYFYQCYWSLQFFPCIVTFIHNDITYSEFIRLLLSQASYIRDGNI